MTNYTDAQKIAMFDVLNAHNKHVASAVRVLGYMMQNPDTTDQKTADVLKVSRPNVTMIKNRYKD